MADKKITGLPVGSTARADDLFEVVQSATSKQISTDEFPFNNPDVPPAIANALDDEFDDPATLPGGASPKWTAVNFGPSALSISKRKLAVTVPFVNSQNVRGIIQTLPAAPWEFQAKCNYNGPESISHQIMGMMLHDTVSTKVKTFGFGFSGTLRMRVNDWNSPTSHSAQPYTADMPWYSSYLKMADDNVNFIFSTSNDGANWFPRFSQPRNTFLTPNRIGLFWYYEFTSGNSYLTFDWFRRTS